MTFRPLTFLAILLGTATPSHAQDQEGVLLETRHTIHSEILNETREYWVGLPDSYELAPGAHREYPVLIVLDGQSQFRPVAGMLPFMSASRNGSRRVPEMIVVGVASSIRERDFTPDKIVTRRENQTGGGDNFLAFLDSELIPALEKSYRTAPYRVLMGHSLGGLLASHAYMQPTSSFNAFLAIDPSFGTWDAATMDEKVAAVTPSSFDRYLYMATANWGNRNLRNRDRHVRFYEALHQRAGSRPFPAGLDYFEGEDHGSVPLIAFYEGMSRLFEGYGISYREVTSAEQLNRHFGAISDRLSHAFPPPEDLVNRAAYQLLRSGEETQVSEALGLFELNVRNYPDSFNAFDSLGEAYRAAGANDKAIASYQKSLELNPANENARIQLGVLLNGN